MEEVCINRIEIINNLSSKYYQRGIEGLGRRNILVGMSPGNGYFSEENMFDILYGMCLLAKKVYVVIPDVPHIHNYTGMGYCQSKAEKKAVKDNNQTRNRLNRVLEVLEHDYNVSSICVIDWSNSVELDVGYQKNYLKILEVYSSNINFKESINQLTLTYLNRRIGTRTVKEIIISEGVKYYLKELSLFVSLDSIIKDIPLIAYYKEWGEGLLVLEEEIKSMGDNFGMIQYRL
jgi:cyclo(L-tyrosyl-L-tyrosyl) synthase